MFISAILVIYYLQILFLSLFVAMGAIVLQSFVEWFIHKFVLHGLGKKKDSFFHHHWLHHKFVRKHANEDVSYQDMFRGKFDTLVLKEAASMFLINLFVSGPMIYFGGPWIALFGYCLIFTSWFYFFIHAYSHVNIEFGKKFLPWHYDHHFFDQNANWSVTSPIADYLFGTRKKSSND